VSSFALQIALLFVLVLLNGVFSMSEIAIISARKARLQQRAEKGDKQARLALDLASSPNQLLSTVQIGITLIGVLAGAFGGATIGRELAGEIQRIRFLARYAGAIGLGIAVILTTYLSLVIGELVPKRLGLHNPERVALTMAPFMRALSRVAAPAVHLLSASTDLVLGILGVPKYAESPVTEEEIRVMMEQGAVSGGIEQVEREMVESVFRLGDQSVGWVMTPRTEIEWLDINDSPEQIRDRIAESVHSRFPVCRDSLDEVLGMVQVRDLLARAMAGESLDLESVLLEPLFVPEAMRVLPVLDEFRNESVHIALVVDEYGVIQGLVTVTDILEAIVGDIPSTDQAEEPLAIQREDGSWLLDGLLPVDDFKELFSVEQLPGEGNYQTLGGFVVDQLGRIPDSGDHFEWDRLRLEVMDMDGNRVDKVLASVKPPETAGNGAEAREG